MAQRRETTDLHWTSSFETVCLFVVFFASAGRYTHEKVRTIVSHMSRFLEWSRRDRWSAWNWCVNRNGLRRPWHWLEAVASGGALFRKSRRKAGATGRDWGKVSESEAILSTTRTIWSRTGETRKRTKNKDTREIYAWDLLFEQLLCELNTLKVAINTQEEITKGFCFKYWWLHQISNNQVFCYFSLLSKKRQCIGAPVVSGLTRLPPAINGVWTNENPPPLIVPPPPPA